MFTGPDRALTATRRLLHDHPVHAFRVSLASLVATSLVVSVALAPFVALHQLEAHRGAPHHPHAAPATDTVAVPSHHAHGTHVHALPGLADVRVQPRHESVAGIAIAQGIIVPFLRVAPVTRSLTRTSRPPRVTHPLSLSSILRI